MYKRVFIDANVLIDTNDKSRTSSEESLKIIYFLIENRVTIYTSCDLITTIYYILAKSNKENALESIEQVITFTKIIDFSNKELEETCKLMRADKNYEDLEDTLQYILAKKEKCELILSNDKGFYSSDIEVMSSKEFYTKLTMKN